MEFLEFLKKAGAKDLLEAALKLIPKGYENTAKSSEEEIQNALIFGGEVVCEVVCESFNFTRSTARVVAACESFGGLISLVIFYPKAWHKAAFAPKNKLIVRGKVQKSAYGVEILAPKILSISGQILPKFPKTRFKNATLLEICKYFNAANFLEQAPQMPQNFAKSLEIIFNPNAEFFAAFTRNGGFFGEFLDGIKFLELFLFSQNLRRKRREFSSRVALNGDFSSWAATLGFELTNGQKCALMDIKADLAKPKAARRVIIGDVGCGKTMVILGAVMIAYPHKVALMAPTSVLARQLYENAVKFLPQNVKIALVCQSQKIGDVKEAHFVIGTHALLYREIGSFALVMIDEQHRFGTAQRAKLERNLSSENIESIESIESENSAFNDILNEDLNLAKNNSKTPIKNDIKRPHILQFSATPIPRTMAMVESNFIDFSFIMDLPYPKDIDSKIIKQENFNELLIHIKKEVAKNNQVAIIYPLVEQTDSIDSIESNNIKNNKIKYTSLKDAQAFWQKQFGDSLYSVYGKERDKERILAEFAERGSVLLATTVIEVGISLPRLSIIVIVGAERFGLAQLHQLRGRVSRNGLKGYCYLFTKAQNVPRLEKFCATKNGFEIARLDLELRQSGELLSGATQSGKQFIWADLANDENIIKIVNNALNYSM